MVPFQVVSVMSSAGLPFEFDDSIWRMGCFRKNTPIWWSILWKTMMLISDCQRRFPSGSEHFDGFSPKIVAQLDTGIRHLVVGFSFNIRNFNKTRGFAGCTSRSLALYFHDGQWSSPSRFIIIGQAPWKMRCSFTLLSFLLRSFSDLTVTVPDSSMVYTRGMQRRYAFFKSRNSWNNSTSKHFHNLINLGTWSIRHGTMDGFPTTKSKIGKPHSWKYDAIYGNDTVWYETSKLNHIVELYRPSIQFVQQTKAARHNDFVTPGNDLQAENPRPLQNSDEPNMQQLCVGM